MGVFLENHAEYGLAVLQDEIEVPVAILNDFGGLEDLLQDGGTVILIAGKNSGQIRPVSIAFLAKLVALHAGQLGEQFLPVLEVPAERNFWKIRRQILQFPLSQLRLL